MITLASTQIHLTFDDGVEKIEASISKNDAEIEDFVFIDQGPDTLSMKKSDVPEFCRRLQEWVAANG